MTVHDLPDPPPSSWETPHPIDRPDVEALLMAWSEAIRHEHRADDLVTLAEELQNALRQREQSLATLRQAAHVLSATSRMEAIALLARDLFCELLAARAGVAWMLGTRCFEAKAALEIDRTHGSLDLPAPNPFPEQPLLLGQWQRLERTDLPSPLPILLAALGHSPLYVPLEHQGLLTGFLLLDAQKNLEQDSALVDTLELLQRLFAAAIHQAWNIRDLEDQRERLRDESTQRERRMETLQHENAALGQGQGHRMEFLGFALDHVRPLFGQLLATMTRLKQDPSLSHDEQGNLLLEGLLLGKRMAEFLRDLTEMARPGRAVAPTPPMPVELGALLEEIRPAVENLHGAARGDFDWPDLSDLPEILASREHLRQVLIALCQGATRLSPQGDLHLWVEREPMHLAIRLLLEGLEMQPADPSLHRTGSMPASEYYARGKSSPGLGLVIAEHIVKGMGGNLRLDRDFFGQGTVVSLEFPLA